MERKKVVVAFGDILGFGTWMRRAITTPEESKELIEAIYKEFERVAAKMGCYVKFLGDGFMFVREINDKKDPAKAFRAIEKFMMEIYELAGNVAQIIQSHYPRPEGFRVRVAMGHVWKRQEYNKWPEYIGYVINLTQRLLEVSAQTLCICHQSISEIFSERKTIIKFEKMPPTKETPRGIDLEDLENLWMFSISKESKS